MPAQAVEDVIEGSAEPITGMKPLGANLIVYKPSSIHQMIYTGFNRQEEATFLPQTITNTAGCLSNASIAEVKGTHVFLSGAGLVQFDGRYARYPARRADEKQGDADRLQDIWPLISYHSRAVGIHWAAKGVYLCAVPYKGSATNNLVIVWDYIRDAFWLWDGLDVKSWFFEDLEQQRLCYADQYGRMFALAGGTDFGTAISAYITTTRLGFDEVVTSKVRAIEVNGQSTDETLTLTTLLNSQTDKTGSINMTDPLEAVWGTGKYDTAKWCGDQARRRRIDLWQIGRDHQIKLSSSVKNGKFQISSLKLGYVSEGKR
jgi:hypothetical protein